MMTTHFNQPASEWRDDARRPTLRAGVWCVGMLLLFVLAGSNLGHAGQFNKLRNIGDDAPTWKDLPDTTGQPHSLDSFQKYDVLVVIFTCCSCPTANDYEPRIADLVTRYAPMRRVGFVAINCNLTRADSPEEMAKRAKKQGYQYPFLFDASQATAKAYGALYTPEFFVLNRERKIVYMGAMDEKNPPAPGGTSFLAEAIDATLAGRAVPRSETLARGCMIRFKR